MGDTMSDGEDWKTRLDEIRELKFLLTKAEERTLLEPWAFWVWGVLVWLGTGLNPFLDQLWHWSLQEAFLRLWVPLFVVGGIVESFALFSRIRRDEIPWISPSFLKLLGGLCGFWVAGTILLLAVLHPGNPLPAIFLLFLSLCFFWLGSITFTKIYLVAALALVAGLVLFVGQWNDFSAYLASGILSGALFLCAGFLSTGNEPVHRE